MRELETLPENAVMHVLSRLRYQDLLNVASTCHALHGLALSDYLWMRLCEPWREHVDLQKWRAGVDSACALFRLLSSFSKLVGYWSAPGLEPRGGLLFVAWGHLSVLAYRIVILEIADMKMQHLFDVVGIPDYCTTTKIFTACLTPAGQRALSLSGALVWSSPYDEFYLELAEHCEASIHDIKQPDALSRPETPSVMTDNIGGTIPSDALQFSHVAKSLDNSFGIGQYVDEDEDCVSVDGNCQVLHFTSERKIKGSLYRRLMVEEARKETPFSGLWTGLYGPHGVEFVNISYTSEEIVATKVVGDVNVPCGQITFKAKIATESSDIPPHLQEIMNGHYERQIPPFTIVKLYEGWGQIADVGFEHAEWVPGKLLVECEDVIAFLWEDDNFAITYQKLHLPSLYEQQKESLVNSIM